MNKVYIVTAGEYSGYHIVKVFCDRDKAQKFINIHEISDYDTYYIEEYNVDNFIPEYKDFLFISYNITTKDLYSEVERRFKDDNYNEQDWEENTEYRNSMWENYDGKYGIEERIYLWREINPNFDIESQKKKYIKSCYEIANRVKYIRDVLHIVDAEEITKMIQSK